MSNTAANITKQDFEVVFSANLPWNMLEGKTVLVTGATGMLASFITGFLVFLRKEKGMDIRTAALCRSRVKAERLFGPMAEEGLLTILEQDVTEPVETSLPIDYILHFAGNASPYFIVNEPVDICRSNLIGTFNMAELARRKGCKKLIFASTREVYGKNEDTEMLKEDSFGTLDCMEDRACYPESKRAAETILHSYFLQYGVNSNAIRIAHSYGPGMQLNNDGRVMADLMGDAVAGRDIILKSSGEAERAFCYISDAVSGIFHIMLKGEAGAAYNLSNETEPVMIRDLAKMLASHRTDIQIKVTYDLSASGKGYCNYKRSGLDTSKTEALGWKPLVSLEEGTRRTLLSFTEK